MPELEANVRLGSTAAVPPFPHEVRFRTQSGHVSDLRHFAFPLVDGRSTFACTLVVSVRIGEMHIRYVPDEEIAGLARRFIREHGPAATDLVTRREYEELGAGNVSGAGICRRLIREIEKLLTLEPVSLLKH